MGDDLKDQLKRHEGLRLKPYRCPAGKLTIGYGRNLEAKGITIGEADLMLENDITEVTRELSRTLPWFFELNFARQDALVNMAYNLGVEGLMKWKKTLQLIRSEDYDGAAKKMETSLWAGQVGNRAKELAEQIRTGRYKDEQ